MLQALAFVRAFEKAEKIKGLYCYRKYANRWKAIGQN